MNEQERLEESVKRLVPVYFPDWSDFSEWRFVWGRSPELMDSEHDEFGMCEDIERVIYLCWEVQTDDELDSMLAHEITHAVCPDPGHCLKFLRILRGVASEARQQGRPGLADWIENHAGNIRPDEEPIKRSPSSDEEVYEEIEDLVQDRLLHSFVDVVRAVAENYGMRPGEIVQLYPRAREVFDAAMLE